MTKKLMGLDVSRNVRFTLKIQKVVYFEKQGSLKKYVSAERHFFEPLSLQYHTFFTNPPPPTPFSFTKTLKKNDKSWYESDRQIFYKINLQTAAVSLFESSLAAQIIPRYYYDHTTTRVVGVAIRVATDEVPSPKLALSEGGSR